jgi:hypothetical protein
LPVRLTYLVVFEPLDSPIAAVDCEIKMRSSQRVCVAVLALTSALVLSACGGKSETKATQSTEELITAPVQEVQASGGFNTPVKIPSGVSFTLSEPASFKPGKFAAGQLPGNRNQQFKVDITNSSTAAVDLTTLIIIGTSANGACVDIFDGDNGMEGAPQELLAVGKSVSFNWGLSCQGKTGEELSLVLSNEGVAIIKVTGKVA